MTGSATATLLALAIAASHGAPANPPIFLTAAEDAGLVRLQVRGEAAAPFVGRYTLETVSGTNHAIQSGAARLTPGHPVALVSLNLSGKPGGWSAVLKVEPEGGAPYELKLDKAP